METHRLRPSLCFHASRSFRCSLALKSFQSKSPITQFHLGSWRLVDWLQVAFLMLQRNVLYNVGNTGPCWILTKRSLHLFWILVYMLDHPFQWVSWWHGRDQILTCHDHISAVFEVHYGVCRMTQESCSPDMGCIGLYQGPEGPWYKPINKRDDKVIILFIYYYFFYIANSKQGSWQQPFNAIHGVVK